MWPSRERGFTLIELLVSSSLGLLMVGIGLSAFISQRQIVDYDLDRTEVNRSIRSAMEILGINIRLAGENLNSSIPAIELIDGASNAPDELILRRNLLDEVLKVCGDITNANDNLIFGVAGTTPGCIYAEQGQNFSSWNTHFTSVGSPAEAYIFDPSSGLGQFFSFTAITDSGTSYFLTLDGGTPWTNQYFVGQAAAYILEEWRFRLNGDVLELIENGDTGNPLQVAYGLSDFQVEIQTDDGTLYNAFTNAENWTDIEHIDVTLGGSKARPDGAVTRTQSAQFFPRNILSN